jgi:hypothetical protein
LMTQSITGRRTWDVVSGVCYDGYYGDTRRQNLIEAFPQGKEAARALGSTDDPDAEMWFLVKDPSGFDGAGEVATASASACFVPRTGRAWLASTEEVELMSVYEQGERRVLSALVTVFGDLLE